MAHSITNLAQALGGTVEGDSSLTVVGATEPGRAAPDELAVALTPSFIEQIPSGKAHVALLPEGADWQHLGLSAAILVSSGRAAMAPLTAAFVAPDEPAAHHPTAEVKGAKLGGGVGLGAFTVIGNGAVIGDGTRLGHHVTIASGAVIGRDVVIHDGVRIGPKVRIGDGSRLHPNVVIGAGTVIEQEGDVGKVNPAVPVGVACRRARRLLGRGEQAQDEVEGDDHIGDVDSPARVTVGASKVGRLDRHGAAE